MKYIITFLFSITSYTIYSQNVNIKIDNTGSIEPKIAISNNNKHMAFGVNKNLILFNLISGQIYKILAHKSQINEITFSPASDYLITSSMIENLTYIRSVENGQIKKEIPKYLCKIKFNKDGSKIIGLGLNYTVVLWDILNNKIINTYIYPEHHRIEDLTFDSQDNAMICEVSNSDIMKENNNIDVFIKKNLTSTVVSNISVKGRWVSSAVFFPDENTVALSLNGDFIKIFDTKNNKEINTFKNRATQLIVEKNKKYILSYVIGTNQEQNINIWKNGTTQTIKVSSQSIESITLLKSKPIILTSTSKDSEESYNKEYIIEILNIESNTKIGTLAFFDDGGYILLSTNNFYYGNKEGLSHLFFMQNNKKTYLSADDKYFDRDLWGKIFDTVKNEPKPIITNIRKDYALIIANENYQDNQTWLHLPNTIAAAKALAKELRETYGFEVEIKEDPTLNEINTTLDRYKNKTYQSQDQLFIFFTGHGDKYNDKDGYYVPKNAKGQGVNCQNQLNYKDLDMNLKNISNKCNHVLIGIAACYAGVYDIPVTDAITADALPTGKFNPKIDRNLYIEKQLKEPSHLYLTSGKGTIQTAQSQDKYSPFMTVLLEILRDKPLRGDYNVLTYEELRAKLSKSGLPDLPTAHSFGSKNENGTFLFIAK